MLGLMILMVFATGAVVLLLGRTVWALHRFAYRAITLDKDQKVPTISVCVAARNETHALAQCLERVLQSDYPKLEILVLDDSSSDDTSVIIKSFAHEGVRFIAGRSLSDGWLGKNHAYQTLIEESSGEYIMFLDVDTTIGVTTISQLMTQLQANKKSMLSVLPRRDDGYYTSAVFGTMRYYWELILASSNNPPAASAVWMVERTKLETSGVGLANYGMSVRPERHLARQLQRDKAYYYLIGAKQLGIGFEKRLASQYETALRLYYPMSGRNLFNWLLASLFLCLLITPLVLIFLVPFGSILNYWAVGLVLIVATTFGLFTHRTYKTISWQLRVLAGPFLVIQELVLLFFSYGRYIFGTVTWKGRLVAAQPDNHGAIHLDE